MYIWQICDSSNWWRLDQILLLTICVRVRLDNGYSLLSNVVWLTPFTILYYQMWAMSVQMNTFTFLQPLKDLYELIVVYMNYLLVSHQHIGKVSDWLILYNSRQDQGSKAPSPFHQLKIDSWMDSHYFICIPRVLEFYC